MTRTERCHLQLRRGHRDGYRLEGLNDVANRAAGPIRVVLINPVTVSA